MSKYRLILMVVLAISITLFTGCVPLSQLYTLHISTNGEGTVSPTGGQYSSGTVVSITATPKDNWKFDHWSGDITSDEPTIKVLMNANKTLTAHFILAQYTVTTAVEGEGRVDQTLIPAPQDTYDQGVTIQLTAVPAEGWIFKEWQGDLAGNKNPTNIILDKDYTVTAIFEKPLMAKWNFLVYLDGDNDLEYYAIEDINEMEEVGSTEDVNILVLVDRNPNYDESNGDWSGSRLYRITKDEENSGDIVSELIYDYGELDMSDPTVLENFLLTCYQNYPSERTVLTLWNHGDGIYPKSIKRTTKRDSQESMKNSPPIIVEGICWDDTTGSDPWDCLTTDEIATALANVQSVTGKKLEIINMDACLMQTLEVAYEWRNEVDYLVGSQEVVPGGGNNYDTLLEVLENNPDISTLEFAQTLVNDYYNYYSTVGDGIETYSALSLGVEFDNLIVAFKNFATALYETTDLEGVSKAWNRVTWFTVLEYNDLYDLARELITYSQDANVVDTASILQEALGDAIVNHKETIEYQGKAFGLSIFLASVKEWPAYSEPNQYTSFLLSKDTDWDEFVLRFVQYTASLTPENLLNVEMTWPSEDCDLGIWEPDNNYYWIDAGPSPNGIFSEDMTNGGTESWKLNAYYDPGYYTPIVYSNNYTGSVNFKLTFNDDIFYITVNVEAGYGYTVSEFHIETIQGVRQLTYKVNQLSQIKKDK